MLIKIHVNVISKEVICDNSNSNFNSNTDSNDDDTSSSDSEYKMEIDVNLPPNICNKEKITVK